MYYECRKRKLWSLILMTDEIRVHTETLKSGWDLHRLSAPTMITEGGGVIDEQYECVTPQRVQHEFLPHGHRPSSYKFRSTEFRRININLAAFLWKTGTVSTTINYSSRTPCKLYDNWRFAFVTSMCSIVASNSTLSTNNLISKFNDHVISLTPVRY